MLLPEENAGFRGYAANLPFGASSPTAPFTGFFLNLCVMTEAHRDGNDEGPCVIIPFGRYKRGKLVLPELGLVFDLRPGQALIFRSREFTHFNLHFEGVRGSFVISFDKEGLTWALRENGWECSNRPAHSS